MLRLVCIGGDNPPVSRNLNLGGAIEMLDAANEAAKLMLDADVPADWYLWEVDRLSDVVAAALAEQKATIAHIEQVRGPTTYPHPAWEEGDDDQEVICEPDLDQLADWDDNIVPLVLR